MQEAIRRGLPNTIKKIMTCLSPEQTIGQKALPGSALGGSPHLWLHTTDRHAALATQKRNTRRFALVSIRFGLVLMSLCGSFLLMIAVQTMTTSPAIAAPLPGPGALTLNPNDQTILYPSGLCMSWAPEDVPQEWKDTGVCSATSGAGFVKKGSANCDPDWVATTSQTGQQERVLSVPTFREEL